MNLSILDISHKWNTAHGLLSGFFYLTCSQGSPMLQYTSVLYPFYRVIFHCMHASHCIHSSIAGHLGYFQFRAIMNNAAMTIHLSFCVEIFPEYIPRWRIAGSYGNGMFNFFRNHQPFFRNVLIFNGMLNFFRNHTVSQSDCIILHSQWGYSDIWGFQFLHMPTNTCLFYEVVSHFSSGLQFPGGKRCWAPS